MDIDVRTHISAFILASLAASHACALEILGLRLGQPVSELKECPVKPLYPGSDRLHYDYPAAREAGAFPCYKRGYEPGRPLHSDSDRFEWEIDYSTSPDFISTDGNRIRVLHRGGTVQYIWITTKGLSHQESAAASLRDKFGEPTTSEVAELTNGYGAKFTSIEMTWKTDTYHVMFSGISGPPSEGVIWIMTSAEAALRADLARQQEERNRL